jgi:hypothetical protein
MTSWGAVLLGSFLYLGLRRPRARSHTVLICVTLTVVVLLAIAAKQHTP